MESVKGVGPGGPHDHASGQEQNGGPGQDQDGGPGPEQNGGPGQEQDGGPGPEQNGGPGQEQDGGPGPEQNSGPGQEQDGGPGPEQNSGPGQDGGPSRPKAENPADLARLFLDRANAGDVAGVVALYEADAVLAFPPGQITVGADAIREVYERFLSQRPTLTSAGQSEPLVNKDVALTSTRLPGGGATVEVARRQPDGTWLWAVDQPRIA